MSWALHMIEAMYPYQLLIPKGMDKETLKDWANENCERHVHIENNPTEYKVYLLNPDDATHFKLRWG